MEEKTEKEYSEPKAVYRRQICFHDDFKDPFKTFTENIQKDLRFDDKKNKSLDKNRLSKAIRFLIGQYNLSIKIKGFPIIKKEGENAKSN